MDHTGKGGNFYSNNTWCATRVSDGTVIIITYLVRPWARKIPFPFSLYLAIIFLVNLMLKLPEKSYYSSDFIMQVLVNSEQSCQLFIYLFHLFIYSFIYFLFFIYLFIHLFIFYFLFIYLFIFLLHLYMKSVSGGGIFYL